MRFSSVIWVAIVAVAAGMLYSVKYQVQAMDEEIAQLHAQIERERASMQVLQAEWAFLTRPERIRQLASRHLDMQPVEGAQLMDVADIPTLGGEDVILAGSDGESLPGGMKPGIVPAGGLGYAR